MKVKYPRSHKEDWVAAIFTVMLPAEAMVYEKLLGTIMQA